MPYCQFILFIEFSVTESGSSLAIPAPALAPIKAAFGMILNGEAQSPAAKTPGTFV